MLLFSVARMNRFNKTEPDIFATCMISLLLKDLLLKNLLQEMVKCTLYRSGVVQACHHGTAEPLLKS